MNLANFNALDFLRFYQIQLSTGTDELMCRALVNRTFLVTYLHVREVLTDLGERFSGSFHDYGKVAKFLRKDIYTSGRAIAGLYEELRQQRRQADYFYPSRFTFSVRRARYNIKRAKTIIELANQL